MSIDHEFTREVVCPHCGYEHTDSWERHMDDGDQDDDTCSRCGKDFTVNCTVTVTYSTEKNETTPTEADEYRDEFVSGLDMGDKS